ncbi:MAG: ArsR/SmtB family transcription factor [Clostridium sp.]|uniref:ArsR/SmtB family transcription factor n=1 Tax=Clostridium sp. TaxID=1506 RepID=UPI003EE799C9
MITPDISNIASIFSDKSRAIMLVELLGGARTTGELAKVAGIKPQTATYHLNKMVGLNIIKNNKYGKNSYYKIESEDIAKILELLMQLSKEPKITSLKESVRSKQIRFARLCYDHIAGKLGVEIFNKLIKNEYVEVLGTSVFLTDEGKDRFKEIGFEVGEEKYIGELCRDWSEKSNHIAGEIGVMIYSNLLNLGLIEKDKESRKLFLTNEGKEFLKEKLGVEI